jgi:ribosomal protein S12 methylthiotransferase
MEEILEEAKKLAKSGIKEIIVIAQDTTKYGEDIYGEKKLSKLLKELCKIEEFEWIRFLYAYPESITDELIKVVKENDKICKYFDIPIQHISDTVLKRMNRKTTGNKIEELIKKIKKEIPDVILRTSLIVGFPGETEEDFEDTLDVVRKVNFEQIFMFIYSKREGTPAAVRKDQIPEEIKHERFERLKELYDSRVDENNEKYLGTVQKILVEGTSKNNDKMLQGRTDTNKVVIFEDKEGINVGDVVKLKITEAHKWYLKGE